MKLTSSSAMAIHAAGLNTLDQALIGWLEGKLKTGVGVIDFRDFLSDYKRKYGKLPCDPVHLKRVIQKIIDLGIIDAVAIASWHTHKVVCYGLKAFLFDSKQKGCEKTKMSDAEKPETQERREQKVEHAFRQQQLEEVRQLCEAEGIVYQDRDLLKVAAYGVEAVKRSLSLFRAQTKRIDRPCGWLRDCLKYGWWKSYSESKQSNRGLKDLLEKILVLRNQVLDNYGVCISTIGEIDIGAMEAIPTPT